MSEAARVCIVLGITKKGGAVSLRHAFFFGLALGVAPFPALAQECPVEEPGCDVGRCPLQKLPYEEFLVTPPGSRSSREIPPVADRPFDPDSGDRLLVRRIVVDGVTANAKTGVTPEAVQENADEAFKRFAQGASEAGMTVGQIVRIADEVTAYYRGKGYLVAKAFVPVQTIGADSVVHLRVLEGRISEVVVEGSKEYSSKVLGRAASRLVGKTPLREEVESALLYSQGFPGVRLFGTFRPGAQPGDTKLVLQVLEEDSFDFKAGVDNYGSEFTGTYRFRGDIYWLNPFGIGDKIDLSLLQSVDPENTTYGSLKYSVPLWTPGMNFYLTGSHNAFQITEDPFSILQLEGSITAYETGLNWRYTRSRFLNMDVSLSYATKQSKLDAVGGRVQVSDDSINVVVLDHSIERVDTKYKGLDLITARVRQGAGADLTGSSATVDPNFTALEARYTRLQSLSETQFLLFRLRGQQTDSRLSPIEQFALAGPDAVRAYPVGEILRDTGSFASLEYRVQAPGFARKPGPFSRQWGDLLQVSLFFDYGQAENAQATRSGGNASAELSGYGAGLQFGIPGEFQFQLQGATPQSSRVAVDGEDFRVYGEFSIEF